MNNDRWLLPEGIEELLPADARLMEGMRRQLLDLFHTWGYELVIPPFVEYVDSLLTGIGNDLDLYTFKLIDQKNGRMMGVRADMTPQVARIDAHQLGRSAPSRLCYIGTVLMTHAMDLTNSRSFTQIGAELYGHAGIESDGEVLSLMIEMLKNIGLTGVFLDLGHVSVFRGLSRQAGLSERQEAELFAALQRKSKPDIDAMLSVLAIDAPVRSMLAELIWLNGGEEVLQNARSVLKTATDEVHRAINELENLAKQIKQLDSSLPIHFDLAEVRGFHYHTGVVFAAYQPGVGQAIAKGGRYDHIGEVFGRARPATGFSADLRTLIKLANKPSAPVTGIFAPYEQDPALLEKIAQLRRQGERVVQALPNQTEEAVQMGCDRKLIKQNNQWLVKNLG